jgi:hyperosmotically inducible periplasmic protein
MRVLIRTLLVIVLVAIVGAFLFGSWAGSKWTGRERDTSAPVGTTGTSGTIDTRKARETGAEIGEKTAVAASKVQHAMGEAALTTKIKAKMALDDAIKARAIDVSTTGSTVTLTGTVSSKEEHDRALALARETDGVTRVIDKLRIER